jgi:arabinogalactan oligomer / maltooligosaccharide transport system substrate-binding protein
MTSWRKWLAVVPLAALVLTGCGGNDNDEAENVPEEATETEPEAEETEEEEEVEETEETEEEAETIERADADLVIWADDTRASVIEPFATEFGEQEGISVAVQEVAFDQIRDTVSLQGPAGQGPDVFIGAHDWLGELVENGVVSSIDLAGSEEEFLDVAIQAFTYDGQIYGLPYSIENIALVRNTELAPDRPASLEEMAQHGLDLVEAGEADVPVSWQQPDVYHNYWLVTANDGYVFAMGDDGSYDASDVGVDSEGSLQAAEVFGDLAERGVVSQDVDYDVMIDTFSSGRSPYAVTGPWALGDFDGIDYVVEALPEVEGGTPGPFVGVQGLMISSFAENELAARTFVLDFMGTDEAQLEFYEAGNRPPALQSAFEQVSDDEVVAGFGEAGETGVPMPAIPEMASVWEAWTDAYTNIFGGMEPTEAFEQAAEQIRNLIGG